MEHIKDNFPLVSVAIITYNQREYLRECIESVLAQDYPNFEIVIADDASTDSTQEMLEEYATKYPCKFILRLNEENRGITKNCNSAHFACSGKYIAFMGGDDFMLKGKISAQVKWLEKDPKRTICGHGLYLCDDNSHIYGSYQSYKKAGIGPSCWIEKGPPYGAPSVMIRAENIPKYGFDERIKTASDWKLYIDVLQHDSIYGYIDEFYAVYRRHKNNVSSNRVVMMNDKELTLNIIESERPKLGLSVRKARACRMYYAHGLHAMKLRSYKMAISYYFGSIKLWPFQYKAYVRILQSIFRL